MALHGDNSSSRKSNSRSNVEARLARAHLLASRGNYFVNFMLTKRRLTRDGLQNSISELESAIEILKNIRGDNYGGTEDGRGKPRPR